LNFIKSRVPSLLDGTPPYPQIQQKPSRINPIFKKSAAIDFFLSQNSFPVKQLYYKGFRHFSCNPFFIPDRQIKKGRTRGALPLTLDL
jgi:3'-phosphoadenosine 5'-phosphosulfate sulfotransferase (PAPS reductase)/FAD synthetase